MERWRDQEKRKEEKWKKGKKKKNKIKVKYRKVKWCKKCKCRLENTDGRRKLYKGGGSQKGEDRTEMKKETRVLRCTFLSGSAWSTERKYMRRFKGKCDIFFGIEHR